MYKLSIGVLGGHGIPCPPPVGGEGSGGGKWPSDYKA